MRNRRAEAREIFKLNTTTEIIMEYILALIILLHGLIHFMGFAKAFGYGNMTQLTKEISRVQGVFWLVAALLFISATFMFLLKKDYWSVVAIIAAIISQVLIFAVWKDAKFGTIANLIIIVAAITAMAGIKYYSLFKQDVKTALQQEVHLPDSLLTETNIQHLPEPVKKYLRYTGCIGKPIVHNFSIAFNGSIRKNEHAPWMPFKSRQYNFIQRPKRLFFMNALMKHLPVMGYHGFNNGDAFMDIRLFSLIRVLYLHGKEMGIAETVTFFNDMCCMAPATLIDKRINWLSTEGNKVKASFTNNNITIIAWLFFNDEGQLINFTSDDRFDANARRRLHWATPLKDYRLVNGYRLAGFAEAIYSYPYGDVCYGNFRLADVAYNIKTA